MAPGSLPTIVEINDKKKSAGKNKQNDFNIQLIKSILSVKQLISHSKKVGDKKKNKAAKLIKCDKVKKKKKSIFNIYIINHKYSDTFFNIKNVIIKRSLPFSYRKVYVFHTTRSYYILIKTHQIIICVVCVLNEK